MLKTTKSTTLTGTSSITTENGEMIVVTMNATIAEDGTSNTINTVLNKEVYEAHKEECRADMDAFTEEVRAIEDAQDTE